MRMIRRFRPAIPEIPRSRRFVADALGSQGASVSDAVLLVTSELVTNAVRHGRGDVELRLDVADGQVRIEVVDDGHAEVPPPGEEPPGTALGGRGLRIVNQASRRWGSGFDAAGRTLVWAELNAG